MNIVGPLSIPKQNSDTFLNAICILLNSAAAASAPFGTDSFAFTLCLALFPFLLFFGLVILRKIQCQRPARARTNVSANADKTLTALVEHVLQTDYNALKIGLASLANVIANFAKIDCWCCVGNDDKSKQCE